VQFLGQGDQSCRFYLHSMPLFQKDLLRDFYGEHTGRLHIDFWSNACSLFSDFQPRRRGMPDKIDSEKAEGAAFVSPRRSPLLRENGQAFDDNIHMRLPWENTSAR